MAYAMASKCNRRAFLYEGIKPATPEWYALKDALLASRVRSMLCVRLKRTWSRHCHAWRRSLGSCPDPSWPPPDTQLSARCRPSHQSRNSSPSSAVQPSQLVAESTKTTLLLTWWQQETDLYGCLGAEITRSALCIIARHWMEYSVLPMIGCSPPQPSLVVHSTMHSSAAC